jgi:hypothetical protein
MIFALIWDRKQFSTPRSTSCTRPHDIETRRQRDKVRDGYRAELASAVEGELGAPVPSLAVLPSGKTATRSRITYVPVVAAFANTDAHQITVAQWFLEWYPQGKTSTESRFNIDGKIGWATMESVGFIALLYIMYSLPKELSLEELPWGNWTMAGCFVRLIRIATRK